MKKPVIEFNQYSFKYNSQIEPTLKDVSLTIYEGEKVLIVGASGSGKTTIGHCLNGLIPFSYKGESSGSLKIMGQETSNMDIFSLSKNVGTVLQDLDGQFIGLSVAEDIAFSLENECIDLQTMVAKVKHAAELVNIEDHLQASVHHLSGGERQRVSMAGILVQPVHILLFDEPLANLDPATGELAIRLIDEIQKESKTTVVIIEHRLEDVLSQEVDRIIVIDNGRVVADASPHILVGSDVLEKSMIREPLYIKAAKYAGCSIDETLCPAHPHTFKLQICKDNFLQWYRNSEIMERKIDGTTILEIREIAFQYTKDVETLQDISFSIQKGEMVSIVGRNGAGKSTLSKIISGFERPQSGQIYYKGIDITGDSLKERSQRIGMVMQNPNHMFSQHYIYDEIALGLKMRGVSEHECKEKVFEIMEICGLYAFRNWPISALSFGQKKRVSIASVLVLQPEIIILDEPTAGQDLKHYSEIMGFLETLSKQGISILIVTHDMHLMLEYTPRTLLIHDGKLLADTSASALMSNATLVAQANLKQTSLYKIAKLLDIQDTQAFIEHFIAVDRKERKKWQ